MKLHLGCGNKKIKGYINIDTRYAPNVDEINNVKYLRNYNKSTVSVIYASHVLEHFSRHEYRSVLERWFELLEDGGILRLAVPNFSAVVEHYLKYKDLNKLMGILYGGQDYAENFHMVIFDFDLLKNELINIGFKSVLPYDHTKTEHSMVDDFSKAYLPHMDPNGILMSLNIEAIK